MKASDNTQKLRHKCVTRQRNFINNELLLRCMCSTSTLLVSDHRAGHTCSLLPPAGCMYKCVFYRTDKKHSGEKSIQNSHTTCQDITGV